MKVEICESCGKPMERVSTEEDMADEFYDNFGTYEGLQDSAVICDACYEEFMKWFKAKQQ